MITIGLLIAAVIVNATKDFSGAACYRIPIGLQFIWAVSESFPAFYVLLAGANISFLPVLGGGLAILPESPRYLIMKGRDEAAQRALSRILGAPLDSPQVHEEYAEIAANLHHERAVGATSYLACFRNGPGALARFALVVSSAPADPSFLN